MHAMDPFAVLGVSPGAAPQEAAAAYRRLAKRWHPDRGGGAAAARRMAEINAAYDLLRAGAWQHDRLRGRATQPAPRANGDGVAAAAAAAAARRRRAGAWLSDALRHALGRELLLALEDGEDIAVVTPAATWASPRTLLAVSDRRLLWLLDDLPSHRVRTLGFRHVAEIGHRLRRPLRRVAVLTVRTTTDRRLAFAELRPATAAAISAHVSARLPSGRTTR
jgi:hypothetical protein